MQVDKITVCTPIEALIKFLQDNGLKLAESKVSDYHFHELYFKMMGNLDKKNQIDIEKINKVDEYNFSCTCHWSIVEVVKAID